MFTAAFFLILIMITAGFVNQNSAMQSALKNEEPLVVAANYCTPRVVSIGTYNFKHRPTINYAGSGFYVGDGRHVVTNAHVIASILKKTSIKNLRVFLKTDKDQQGRVAKVVAVDALHDIALLKVDGPKQQVFSLDIKKPLTGRSICVMGFPIGSILGFQPLFHEGTVSATVPAVLPMPRGVKLTEKLKKHIENPYNMYQLNIIMYPGNSGSPLVDTKSHKVIGIINSVMGRSVREHLVSHPTGISYAIPAKWIKRILLENRIKLN